MAESGGSRSKPRITIIKDGPYKVEGGARLRRQTIVSNAVGQALMWEDGDAVHTEETYFLCRCGRSSKAPFCDGSHAEHGFRGDENANSEPYIENAELTEGPNLILTDNIRLCAGARFCESSGGTWRLTEKSDDPKARQIAVRQAGDCPSGRLVAYDKDTFEPMEPDFRKEIILIEDPAARCSGPLWVKAGITIASSDGYEYETRNRVTLCRCGKSSNMPFCDGSHMKAGFTEKNGKYDETK